MPLPATEIVRGRRYAGLNRPREVLAIQWTACRTGPIVVTVFWRHADGADPRRGQSSLADFAAWATAPLEESP